MREEHALGIRTNCNDKLHHHDHHYYHAITTIALFLLVMEN